MFEAMGMGTVELVEDERLDDRELRVEDGIGRSEEEGGAS